MAAESENNCSKGESPYKLYVILKELSVNNAQFFEKDESEYGQRMHASIQAINQHVDILINLVDEIRKKSPEYDFENVQANGYRSFEAVVDSCIKHTLKINRHIESHKESFLFRKSVYMKEIEACLHLMASLSTCLELSKTLLTWSDPGELFPKDEANNSEELLKQAESINLYPFYGRCLGFQFCESFQKILKTISICMASFSDIYYSKSGIISKATNSVWNGGKYFLDPELKAKRIVHISQYANIDFCKSFWWLNESEFMSHLPSMVCPTIEINKVIFIPSETLEHKNLKGEIINVPIPNSFIGRKSIQARLLSSHRREGMISEDKDKSVSKLPPCKNLIIHCHGGGFVAQSSKSHEMYLREWACHLKTPILSIDYSLAPEAPFPRALEEVLYSYCWALNNGPKLLGSTCEKVIFTGDSAGGNLLLATTLKCIHMSLRLPDGIFLAYVPVLVSFVPSPSRLLCLMDPLLPFGFMIRCLKAYTTPQDNQDNNIDQSKSTNSTASITLLEEGLDPKNGETESFEEVSESDLVELAARKSPLSELGTDTLTTVSLTSLQSRATEADQSKKSDHSETYVSEFLEKYVLDTETDIDGSQIPVLRSEPQPNTSSEQQPGISSKFGKAMVHIANNVSNMYDYMTGKKTPINESQNGQISPNSDSWLEIPHIDGLMQKSPSEEFKFNVPKDPYLSPYWAKDEDLRKLPPVNILSVQFDPCLDDCVMFAKKLKKLGNSVNLDVLDGLPHGFLNFSMFNKDAHHGSNVCIERIQSLLAVNSLIENEAEN